MVSRCGHSALRSPKKVWIQAWSVGVPGRPKWVAMACRPMNCRVDPEVGVRQECRCLGLMLVVR